jgi:hypothetical protein
MVSLLCCIAAPSQVRINTRCEAPFSRLAHSVATPRLLFASLRIFASKEKASCIDIARSASEASPRVEREVVDRTYLSTDASFRLSPIANYFSFLCKPFQILMISFVARSPVSCQKVLLTIRPDRLTELEDEQRMRSSRAHLRVLG